MGLVVAGLGVDLVVVGVDVDFVVAVVVGIVVVKFVVVELEQWFAAVGFQVYGEHLGRWYLL